MRYIEKYLNKEEYIGFLKGKILECFMTDKKNTAKDMRDFQQYAKQLEELYQSLEKARHEKYKTIGKEPVRSIDNNLKINPDEYQTGDYIKYVDRRCPNEVREGIVKTKDDDGVVLDNKSLHEGYVFLYNEGCLLKHTPKLKYNKWYDARLYTKEELELLLPTDTRVTVATHGFDDEGHIVHSSPSMRASVRNISDNNPRLRVEFEGIYFSRDWFKIVNQQEK